MIPGVLVGVGGRYVIDAVALVDAQRPLPLAAAERVNRPSERASHVSGFHEVDGEQEDLAYEDFAGAHGPHEAGVPVAGVGQFGCGFVGPTRSEG